MGVKSSAVVAEFIAMTLFVYTGVGTACTTDNEDQAKQLKVALTFGIAIAVLAYSIGHYSGGHINCAVTLGLVVAGQCDVDQGIANLVALDA